MTAIKTKFGFDTILLGGTIIYTCKIRIELMCKVKNPPAGIRFLPSYKKLTEISYETTSNDTNNAYIKYIGVILKSTAEAKVARKYKWVENMEEGNYE